MHKLWKTCPRERLEHAFAFQGAMTRVLLKNEKALWRRIKKGEEIIRKFSESEYTSAYLTPLQERAKKFLLEKQ